MFSRVIQTLITHHLGELNLAYKDLILYINIDSLVRNLAFGLVRNAKKMEFPKESCKVAWNRLVNKYALITVTFLLKL